jgi:hypothetical protein
MDTHSLKEYAKDIGCENGQCMIDYSKLFLNICMKNI